MMTWYKHNLRTQKDIVEFIRTFKKLKPTFGSFDTETNGLHIIKSTPFLLAFGFVNSEKREGHTYTLHLNSDIKDDTMYAFIQLFNGLEKVVAWNAKFDLHMMHNVGYPNLFNHNITDAMIYVRLAHDALSKKQGGVPDSLKDYAKRFIDVHAKDHERKIKIAISDLKKQRTKTLKQALQGQPIPSFLKAQSNNWTMLLVDSLLNDKVLGIEDLDTKLQAIFNKWIKETPDPNDYSNIPIEIVEPYAHMDIVYTLEAFLKVKEAAEARFQKESIKLEEDLIYPLYRMERVGFSFNRTYALEAKARLKTYILKLREELKTRASRDITAGQHEAIKEVFLNKYQEDLPSVGQDILKSKTFKSQEASDFRDTILELRTLEKWYSTYLTKLLEEEVDGRIYTTIKQTGAASGRVSSDFQQFPKNAIEDRDGNELFHPRKMIKVSGGKYNTLAYIDYSQIELRIQALYTIIADKPDKNLCRAYMPYWCYKVVNGSPVAFEPEKHLSEWESNEWYLKESPGTKWTPTDLHTLTTLEAFKEITEDHPEFNKYRKMGKMANFACNYGGTVLALTDSFGREIATKLYNAYNQSYPGVIAFRSKVQQMIDTFGYAENLYGRKYYGVSAHLASNYLVQGSAADFLKAKIIEVDRFLLNYKTRFQMNIHDELSFEIHDEDPPTIIEDIKKIMENLPQTLVPIVADVETSQSTWADAS